MQDFIDIVIKIFASAPISSYPPLFSISLNLAYKATISKPNQQIFVYPANMQATINFHYVCINSFK
jgi:hypothetical protein